MVMFGPLVFQHVLSMKIQKARVLVERTIPLRPVDYRVAFADLGRTLSVAGEIRATTITDALQALEMLRRLRDGVARTFDLQDGTTAAFTAKMGTLQSSIIAENWYSGRYFIAYTVELLEST